MNCHNSGFGFKVTLLASFTTMGFFLKRRVLVLKLRDASSSLIPCVPITISKPAKVGTMCAVMTNTFFCTIISKLMVLLELIIFPFPTTNLLLEIAFCGNTLK